MYHTNIVQFLLAMDDHMTRVKNAETIKHLKKTIGVFFIASMLVYGVMGYMGIGSGMLLKDSLAFTAGVYESSKFWFLIGKVLLGLLFAAYMLFIPALLFKWLTNIAFNKLVYMQLMVLFVLLIERIIWFLLVVTAGLDWYVSPFSFGIIAAYLTEKSWVIVFLGAISIFQIWVIWFQGKFLSKMLENEEKVIIWVSVILLHLVEWGVVALLATAAPYMISGWFG